ncbi:MAG TPA: inositol monophosphatase family protein [Capillimicrobium sp.]|nr:inositol monophosphatase family protein [Capillimicrobium sp.]
MTATTTPPSAELVAVAERLARAAGDRLRERFRDVSGLAVQTKSSPTDVASEADLEAEATIRALLGELRPSDGLLAEEGGGDARAEPGRLRWIVDPLDGTTNFLFGVPVWCVSVACEDASGPLAAVVYDPLRGELFAATHDGPALLGGAPVAPAPVRPLSEALVGTGFDYDAGIRGRQAERLVALMPRVRDIRRLGSAALDLAWLAAGRYDAYVERGIAPWDIAAGSLLVRRAGLEVRDLPAGDGLPAGIAAGRTELLDELAALRL